MPESTPQRAPQPPPKSELRASMSALWLLARKDLRVELRAKDTLFTLALFAAVLAFLFAFSLVGDPQSNRRVLPGILWASQLFIGALTVGRSFARETEDDAFTALLLSPCPRWALLAAKSIGNFTLIALSSALLLPLLTMLLNVSLGESWGGLMLALLLGALAFAAVATPLTVMAASAQLPEVLLPMLLFPLLAPAIICGVRGSAAALGVSVDLDPTPWFQLLAAFDISFLVGGLLLFDWMVSE